jgi:NitT/TauT family transport system substrate-binding protein
MDQVTFAQYSGKTANIIFAPVYIALARGYFKDADIDLTIDNPKEQPWVTVSETRADCSPGFIDYCTDPEFVGKLRAVAVHEQFREGHGLTSLLARTAIIKDGSLTPDPASIKGKTIGLLGGRGDDYLAYHGVLTQAGLTIDDVKINATPHGGDARRVALEKGEVDLVIGRRPNGVAGEVATGEVVRWKVGDEVNRDLQARYIMFSTPFMNERPEVGVRFLSAYLRGARDYVDAFDKSVGRDETLAVLMEQTGETAELLTSMKPLGFVPNGRADEGRIAGDIDALVERGLMPKGTTFEAVFDRSFSDAAVAAIGEYQ